MASAYIAQLGRLLEEQEGPSILDQHQQLVIFHPVKVIFIYFLKLSHRILIKFNPTEMAYESSIVRWSAYQFQYPNLSTSFI